MFHDCVFMQNMLVFVNVLLGLCKKVILPCIASFLHKPPSMCKEHLTGDGNPKTTTLLKFETNGMPSIHR